MAAQKGPLLLPTLRVRNSLKVSRWRSCLSFTLSTMATQKLRRAPQDLFFAKDFFSGPTIQGNIFLDKPTFGNNSVKWMLVLVAAAGKKSSRAPSLEDHSKQNSLSGHSLLLTFSLRWIHALKHIHGQLLAVSLYCLTKAHHLLPLCPRYNHYMRKSQRAFSWGQI